MSGAENFRNDVLDAADLQKLSGLEAMQSIADGHLPPAPIAEAMNFTLVSVTRGSARFEGAPLAQMRNPMGTTHGGWYGAILDSAMAVAVQSCLDAGTISTTLEYKVNILRPIPVGMQVCAEGEVRHAGRSTAVADARLTGIEDGRLYATASTTCIILSPKG